MLTQGGGGKPSFINFLLCQKIFFWAKGGHGRFGQGVNTPLSIPKVAIVEGNTLTILAVY